MGGETRQRQRQPEISAIGDVHSPSTPPPAEAGTQAGAARGRRGGGAADAFLLLSGDVCKQPCFDAFCSAPTDSPYRHAGRGLEGWLSQSGNSHHSPRERHVCGGTTEWPQPTICFSLDSNSKTIRLRAWGRGGVRGFEPRPALLVNAMGPQISH